MEANKDAALHYLELAEKAIQVNDIERAVRCIKKSEDLFPTQKAKNLLERIEKSSFEPPNKNRSEESTTTSSNHDHPTSNGTSSQTRHRATSSSASAADYTAEEAEAVRKIKTCKDLYEILGVSKTATEADLKKAYRKLALQFHPDKCKAPGATDAFKAIGKAFSVLSDPKKREQYDQYGQAMEPQYHRSGHTGGRQQYYYYEDDDDFSAEEIFNMFFGQGVATRAHRRRHQPHSFHFATNSTQNTTHTLAQLLPYLFLFLISILGTLFVSDPQFQLHRTGKFTQLRTTRSPKIEYYVKPDFRSPKTQADLDSLESSVVDEYVSDLRQRCHREQQYKESLLWRARMMNDQNLYRQAQQQTTPSCTKLNDLIRNYG